MLNDPNCKVAPDWWCIAFDETQNWNIDEQDRPFIDKMLGIYIFDRASYTYCCELTPSYYLIYIRDVVVSKQDVTDEVRERLCEKYESLFQGDNCYMHVRAVESIDAEQKHQYGVVDNWEELEDRGEAKVLEHYQGNPVF